MSSSSSSSRLNRRDNNNKSLNATEKSSEAMDTESKEPRCVARLSRLLDDLTHDPGPTLTLDSKELTAFLGHVTSTLALIRGPSTSLQTLTRLSALLRASLDDSLTRADSKFAELARDGLVDTYRLFLLDTPEALALDSGPLRLYLLDKRYYPKTLSVLVDLVVYVPDIQNRAYLASVFEADLLPLTEIDVPERTVRDHLGSLDLLLKHFNDRLFVLTRLEIKYYKRIILAVKEIAGFIQTEEALTLKLIESILPLILSAIGKLSAFKSIAFPKQYNELTTTCLYFVANLCGSTVPCQEAIAKQNPVRPIMELLKPGELSHAAWHTVNWCIIPDEAKVDFIRLGGAELIAKELAAPKLSSTNIIYCARKLAMLPESRRKLIENGVVEFLLNYRNRNAVDKKILFVTSLAFSFVVLEDEEPWLATVKKQRAREELLDTTQKLFDEATDTSLGVLYVELLHCRKLMLSSVTESQCFGTWWVLHLLTCQNQKVYDRDYCSMAFRDGIVKVLISMVAQEDPSSFLFRLASGCLLQLTDNELDKMRLINAGMLAIFPKLLKCKSVHSSYPLDTMRRMLEDPSHYRHRATPTLVSSVEKYICDNTDRDDFALVVDFAELNQFKNLEIYFLSSIFKEGIKKSDVLSVQDDLPRSILEALFDWQLEFAETRINSVLSTLSKRRRANQRVEDEGSSEEGSDEEDLPSDQELSDHFAEAISLCVQFQLRPSLLELLRLAQDLSIEQSVESKQLSSLFLSQSN